MLTTTLTDRLRFAALLRLPSFLLVLALSCIPATAVEEKNPTAFDVAAGDAIETLKLAARQAGQEIVFLADEVRGVRTAAIAGTMSLGQALDAMLRGTALVAVRDEITGAYAISRPAAAPRATTAAAAPAASAASSGEDVIVLTPFEVSEKSDRGYLSNSAVSASRVSTPIRNIPQSIFVLTGEFLRDQSPLDLNDVLRYAPGVIVGEGIGEIPTIRGFAVPIPLQNGLRFPRGFPTEQADIDRTEILLGPASILYGNVFGVSGVVNRITKRPQFTPAGSLQVQIKSEDFLGRGVLDLTGPLGAGNKLAYRAIGVFQQAELAQDFSTIDRYGIYPKLLWQVAPGTSFLLEIEYVKQESFQGLGPGLSRDYFLNGRIIEVPRSTNPSEDFNETESERKGVSTQLTTRLGEEWTMRFATLDYWPTQDFYEVPIAPAINADGRTINRNQGGNIVRRERELQNHFYQFDLAGTQKFDRVVVKPLFSVDYGIDIDANRRSRSSTAFAPLDLFTPNYSAVLPSDFAFLSDQETTTHQWAGTAMIQAEFLDERVIFTAGLRGTDFFQKTKNRVTGASSPKVNGKFETVPRYGIVVRPVRDVSLYYGYGEAFQALTTVNPDGVGFDAIRGEQHEVGVKTELFAGKLALTVAVFRLDRVNALESDPTRPGFQIPSGGQRAEGYDLSAILSLTQDWQVIAGYAHTEAEVKSAINQINVGLTLTGVPQDYANIWTRYRFSEGPVKGLAIGLGAVSASSNPVLVPNNPAAARLSLPSYNTFDAMLSYDVSTKLRFQLNVRNLTDERYYPQGTATNLSLGDARTFSLTTTYRF